MRADGEEPTMTVYGFDTGTAAVIGPFLVPLGAFAVAVAAIVSGAWRTAQAQRLMAEQRMALIGRGVPLEEINRMLGTMDRDARMPRDPLRSLGNARRTAVVLISSGLGILAFGVVLAIIVRERDALVVAATGLVPLLVGVGFWVDYRIQGRELRRLGEAPLDERVRG